MPAFPPGVHRKGGQAAASTHVAMAREFYGPLLALVAELRRSGLSLRAIAGELQRRGLKTRQGWKEWSATQVGRVLARAAGAGHAVVTAEEAGGEEGLKPARGLAASPGGRPIPVLMSFVLAALPAPPATRRHR
jgi:hypothetical protein